MTKAQVSDDLANIGHHGHGVAGNFLRALSCSPENAID
jgi:hypothetical protein